MLSTLDKSAVKIFLKASKELIRKRKRYIEPRYYDLNGKKVYYLQAILDLGIVKKEDIWNYILELKEEDCFDVSPDRDVKRDMNSEVFEFKKEINGQLAYIKLTLRSNGEDKIICFSFHEDVDKEE